MSEAPAITEGRAASSLGERLYAATAKAWDWAAEWHDLTPGAQTINDKIAVQFTASLTYAESEGVREALLSSVLLGALKGLMPTAEYGADVARAIHAEGFTSRTKAVRAARAAIKLADATSPIPQTEA